jgi:hypothetical protein
MIKPNGCERPKRETEKMAEIYVNSYCTIAAHSADHGFLDKPHPNPRLVHLDGSSKKN